MFKFEQLFAENDIPLDCKLHSKNYKTILDRKFVQLISEQENEQILLEQALQDHTQLKQQLAEFIRQSHQQGLQVRKKPNKVSSQQKKYELRSLEAQNEQIENLLYDRKNTQGGMQEEVELLGTKLVELKDESAQTQEQLHQTTQIVQELSISYSNLAGQMQTVKNSYIGQQQEIKSNNQKFNQLLGNSVHYEQETEKLNNELSRLVPKIQNKQLKIEELDNLKQHLEQELLEKNQILEESRLNLKEIEDNQAKTNNFDKLIKQESKAQVQLQTERKLLLDEFQRICKISGIDQLAQQADEGVLQEIDLKIQNNQQTIESQDKQISQHQNEIHQLLQSEEQLSNRRSELLVRYAGLEKQMDELSRKFSKLEKVQ